MDELDLGNTIKGFIPGQKVLNRYKLGRILGRGGMGVVWLARDEELERDVALKFLPEIVALDPEAVADLKRETRRNLDLTHPHIVRIHDFVSDKRTAAIAMEYVAGSTLAALKLERPGRVFTVDELRPWVEQLLEALHYAHTKAKVVHRDLKPANLMITDGGELKITDFGIATSITDSVSRVSKQAGASGTPVYMSPQQMMGEKAAVTDDIYAVGATLYELLTSKPPFHSGNIVMQVQGKAAPPLAERRAELGIQGEPVPPEWEEAIAACLAKDPASRPQSARDLAGRLRAPPAIPGNPAPAVAPARPAQIPATSPAGKSERAVFRVGLAMVAVVAAALVYRHAFLLPSREETRRAAQELLDRDERLKKQKEEANQGRLQPTVGQRWSVPELGLEMIPIAAGTFQMGSASGGNDDERPVTKVSLTRPFWLGKTEVTQAQWSAVMGTSVQQQRDKANPAWELNGVGETHPMYYVSWEEAMEFCVRLTERERAAGRLPEGHAYRLPTEAQWEYACRAGTTGDYAGNLAAMGWYADNSGGVTKPVAQLQANAWGVHDLHGGLWEWCLDWYGGYPGDSVRDPIGPPSGSFRVLRGGGWMNFAARCRSSVRSCEVADYRYSDVGFRVALVPDVPLPRPQQEAPRVATARQPRPGQPWENSLGQKFVPVPGTEVLFCIWETRVQDFEAFVRATGYDATAGAYTLNAAGKWGQHGGSWRNPGFAQTGQHPVSCISQADAEAFCRWLTDEERREGRLGIGQEYRLPTYSEWSAAAGEAEFPWGSQWPPPRGAGNYADAAAKRQWSDWTTMDDYDDGHAATAPVGSFTPNRFGIHDLGGNLWERVGGQYSGLRGASFGSSGRSNLASSRSFEFDGRTHDVGFRIVCATGSAR